MQHNWGDKFALAESVEQEVIGGCQLIMKSDGTHDSSCINNDIQNGGVHLVDEQFQIAGLFLAKENYTEP